MGAWVDKFCFVFNIGACVIFRSYGAGVNIMFCCLLYLIQLVLLCRSKMYTVLETR